MEELRVSGYSDISQVEFAMLETNGQISVVPKPSARPLTAEDVGLENKNEQVPRTVIVDGELDEEEIQNSGKSKTWLKKQLAANGIKDIKMVFIATVDSNGSLFVQTKEK